MDTHYVDQYIRNKRRSEAGTPSSSAADNTNNYPQQQQNQYQSSTAAPGGNSSSSYRAPSSYGNSGNPQQQYHSTSGASGGRINQAAHQVLLGAAHRAQHEVDAVSNAAAELALREEHAERVERQYSLLSERVDTTSLQVASAEDKVINVTKMLKLLQQLSEDREKSLRDESGELRTKIKRLERALESERETREKMSESMTQYVREAVERAVEQQNTALRADFQRQLDQFDVTVRSTGRQGEELRQDVDEVRRVADKFGTVLREVEQFCGRFADESRASTKTLVESRLEEFRIRNEGQQQRVDDLREKVEDVHDRLTETVTSQHELRRSLEDIKRRSDPLKEWVEDRVTVLKSEMKEQLQRESDKLTSQLHVSLANTNAVLEVNENSINDLRGELERLASTMHGHVKSVDSNNEKAAESFQDLRELSQQSRDLLVNQLEATKDWASRNILRLKKHLDLAVSDMAATRQAQLEMQVQFQKLTQAHNDEKAALLQRLAHKEKEVSLLTSAIDREVAEVQHMVHNSHESLHNAQMKRQAREELRALSHMP